MPNVYRYVDWLVGSGNDEYGYHTDIRIALLEFPIVKLTKCGIQIELFPEKTRFVRSLARKKFACTTKEEALHSYRKRKEAQIRILESHLYYARSALSIAETMVNQSDQI